MTKTGTSILEALINRRRDPEPMRRPDFKGDRFRMSVRLPRKTIVELEIIKVATGEDKNAFIEQQLNAAIEGKLKEVKRKHGDEAWGVHRRARQRSRGLTARPTGWWYLGFW